MRQKIIVSILLIMFMFSTFASAQNMQDMTLLDKIVAVEKIYYGSEQTGSLVERTAKLENDIYGVETQDALMTKLDRIYTYTKDNSDFAPSFIMKLNAVEWALTHDVTSLSAKERVENLERVLLGSSTAGAFEDRVNKLLKLAYTDGQIATANTILDKDTLVKIKIVTPLNTKTSRPGDVVMFQAADDVYSGGQLVIAKGAQGFGKVTKVEPAKNFGRDAKLEISFDSIEAMDGNGIATFLGDKAKEETKSLAKAAGATVVGLAILGPVGVVGGAFVRGEDVNIPADSLMYIQTKDEIETYGLQVKAPI